jgi:predicted  nucleic acid-binding Zn-ribbon protein
MLAEMLWQLQQVDGELAIKRKILKDSSFKEKLMEKRESLRLTQEQIIKLKDKIENLTKELLRLEKDLKYRIEKRNDIDKIIYDGTITSSKELSSLETKINEYKQREKTMEDQVITIMEEIETIQELIAKQEPLLKNEIKEYNQSREKYLKDREQLKLEVQLLESQKLKLEGSIDNKALLAYQKIYAEKGGIAVSKLDGEKCSVCRITLPTGFVSNVKHSVKISHCENCGRILYAK